MTVATEVRITGQPMHHCEKRRGQLYFMPLRTIEERHAQFT